MVFGNPLRHFFTFSPPGLTSSSRPYRKFLKGESFKFLRKLPVKNLCQHFFHQITTPSRSSHSPCESRSLENGWEERRHVNILVVGSFEEEEEGTGIASDVVKVEGEDPDTLGCLRGDRVRLGRRWSRIVGVSPLARSRWSPGTVHNDSPILV